MIPAYLEAGSGPAVVFLHGIGGEAVLWQRQIAHFSARFRAIAWDMPGYGRTPLLAATRWDNLADAAICLLNDLRVERAHLVGHSMGGMLAQYLAHRDLPRVASLVLAGTSAVFGSADGRFQKQFLAARLEPLDAGCSLSELAPDLIAELLGDDPDPAGVEEAVAAMAHVDPIAYRATLQCLATFDNRANISALAVPTLLIAGEKDRAAPPAGMERMAARIAGSQYVCLPGCGHLMHLEQPKTFNAVLDEFYAALERAGNATSS